MGKTFFLVFSLSLCGQKRWLPQACSQLQRTQLFLQQSWLSLQQQQRCTFRCGKWNLPVHELHLTQAYYQLRVAEESIHLLVFLCPWDKMCMARLLMGWTGSGDYLHITTWALLTGMDRAIDIFDDLLMQPHSGTEAYQLGAKILCQAIQRRT